MKAAWIWRTGVADVWPGKVATNASGHKARYVTLFGRSS
jgi:hypothetical protein